MVIRVGGLTTFSATDYPGLLSAVVFCQGCPWRCRYCHNPDLIDVRKDSAIEWEQVLNFLESRRSLLDGVVFSGGEPSLQTNLFEAILEVKELGFKIGLHSSGACFNGLKKVLPLIDWIGLDIKALPENYRSVTGINKSERAAWKSLAAVMEHNTEHEVRSTVHPGILLRHDIIALAQSIAAYGVKKYILQEFRSIGCIDQDLNNTVQFNYIDEELIAKLSGLFEVFEVRRA